MNARHLGQAVVFSVSFAVLSVAPAPARAYQIDSPVSAGCHERLTLEVLDAAGWPDGREAPPVGRYDRAIVGDLPFGVPDRAKNQWALSLLIGARDNDLRGHAIEDFASTSSIHNDPDGQAAHCLRSPWDDGAQGDHQAMTECRGFILDELAEAIGDADEIDLDATERVGVSLSFRGETEIPATRFAFHTGRALHALEDGFTHTFRSPDGKKVRHVLNWVDWAVEPGYSAARDGHAHVDALDICDGATEARRRRAAVTVEAGTALLDAIVDGTGGREGRLARARAVLDEYFTVESGCTFENDWCDAPELGEQAGCSAAPGTPRAARSAGALVGLFALAIVVARRRRATLLAAAGLVAIVAFAPRTAEASQPAEPRLSASEDLVPEHRFALAANLGLSIQRAAASGSLGVRYALAPRLVVGLDAEWNPWFTVAPAEAVAGVASFYATGTYVLAKRAGTDGPELRTTVHAGASVLLFDMVGALAGSVGPYVAWNLLGIAIPAGRARIVIDPATFCLPVPQLHGVPFYYMQYRATVGVELGI